MENIKKELEAVKRDLANKNELVSELKHDMKRVSFMLNEWIEDYSFIEKPDPIAAYNCLKDMSNPNDIHGEQSIKWFWEYNKIHTLIDVALEYTIKADKTIKLYEQAK